MALCDQRMIHLVAASDCLVYGIPLRQIATPEPNDRYIQLVPTDQRAAFADFSTLLQTAVAGRTQDPAPDIDRILAVPELRIAGRVLAAAIYGDRNDYRTALSLINDAIIATETQFDNDIFRYGQCVALTRDLSTEFKRQVPLIKNHSSSGNPPYRDEFSAFNAIKAEIPFYYIGSYPRSGNTMLRQFLAYTFDAPRYSVFPGDGCLFSRNHLPMQLPKALFVKDHLVRPEYREDPILYLVRDGRESILSYARYLFASGKYSNVGRGGLADFIRETASDYWLSWAANVKRALNAIDAGWPITLLRYEDINKKPEALYQLADRLNTAGLPLRRDYAAYQEHEKSEKAKLAIYPEWSETVAIPKDSFLAEGWTVGGGKTDWRAAFDARASREFHEQGGTDILLRLGYETSADWWRAAEPKSSRTISVAQSGAASADSPFAYGDCEICGSRFKILLRHVGTAHSQKRIPLYYCMDCESFTCIGDYVETAEQAQADVEHYTRNVDYKRKNFGRLAAFLSATLFDGQPRGVSHADIGCGIGALVKAFAEAGYQTAGYDLDRFAIERAKVLFGDLDFRHEAAGADGQQFDLVTLIDVLEHVKEPGAFFQTLVGCVKPGGHLFVVVPRVDRDAWQYLDEPVDLQFSVRETTPFRDNDVHVVHYSSKGLERIGLRHGVEVVRDYRDQAWPLNGILYRRP